MRQRLTIRLLVAALMLAFVPAAAYSQESDDEEDYTDEINVTVDVRGIGVAEMPAAYNGSEIYLSVVYLFNYLKVRNIPSPSRDTISGFYINESTPYLIDKTNNRVSFKGATYDLKKDGFIKTETDLYMNLRYFKTIFGLDGSFNFRRLEVNMSSDVELPAQIEARQETMRKNISKLKGEVKTDTTIARTHPFFHFGMIDWAVMSAQQSQSGDQTTVNIGMGSVLAGGELNTSFNYYSQQPLTEKLQYYQWRHVNNDNKALRQVIAGKIFTQATSTMYAPVVGVQLTNASTIYRKSYGTYTLSNTTNPGWLVELYVNDVLIDYKKADASGLYSFEVPLIYGFTVVKLKFYGPYGEVRTSQEYINIPFNFLPKKQFEYNVSGGIVEDKHNSQFSKLNMKYGLSEHVTIGGGTEYLTSVSSGNTMPFVNASFRLAPRMMLSGEYMYSVRTRGIFNYRLPKGLNMELDYIKYAKGQKAIFYNYLEDRKVILSSPLRAFGLSLFTRLTVDQILLPTNQYTNTEWTITGFVGRVGVNLSTYSSLVPNVGASYIYNVAALTVPLPAKMIATAQMQYDIKHNKPVFLKMNLEKRILKQGYVNLAYQEYFVVNNRNILVGMRYDFSYARTAVSVLSGTNNIYSRVEAASGSLKFDHKSGYAVATNRTGVGRGGITIAPFLDMNNNGRRDKGEQRAVGLRGKVSGGRVIYDTKDTMMRIIDLEPYVNYTIDLDRAGFDMISWQLPYETMSVQAPANDFRLVEVPVKVAGEASGMVMLSSDNGRKEKGLGQMIIRIYDQDGREVAHQLSEGDGYYSYLGLKPGCYIVRIDSAQMDKLQMNCTPASRFICVKENMEGDVADGLDFTLKRMKEK